jgi:hypothetical protein
MLVVGGLAAGAAYGIGIALMVMNIKTGMNIIMN